MSTPQFCPSMAVQVRERDGAWIVYQCARPFGHDDERPHRNGIASDAGAWTDDEARDSIEHLRSIAATEYGKAIADVREAIGDRRLLPHLDDIAAQETVNDYLDDLVGA